MARPNLIKQVQRMLPLIRVLSNEGQEYTIKELADVLGVSEEVALKDVESLMCCGAHDLYMNFYTDEIDGETTAVVWNEAPALTRALRLSVKETRALIASLDAAGIDKNDSLREKLVNAVGARDLTRTTLDDLVHISTSLENGEVLGSLSHAISENYVIKIDYQGFGDEEAHTRIIEPLQLITENEFWYCVAWCRNASAIRTFRVDRIADIKILDETFTPRKVSWKTPQAYVKNAPKALIAIYDTHVLETLTLPGIKLVDKKTAQDVKVKHSIKDTAHIASIPYINKNWLATMIVASLGDIELIEPIDLKEKIRGIAQKKIALLEKTEL